LAATFVRKNRNAAMNISTIDKSKLARTDQELVELAASDADWLARTSDDVRQLRGHVGNVFARLPEPDFRAFLSSLKFKNGGVAGGCYKPLMNTLTLSEIFEVFGHFGMSMQLFTDEATDSCMECACPDCHFSFWDFCSSLCAATVKSE
jgi:hypothetical protein